jgi:hypothetical protein
MLSRFVALATVVVCVAALQSGPRSIVAVEPQQTAMQIDFDSLHTQATAALESLQLAHERRLASIEAAEF